LSRDPFYFYFLIGQVASNRRRALWGASAKARSSKCAGLPAPALSLRAPPRLSNARALKVFFASGSLADPAVERVWRDFAFVRQVVDRKVQGGEKAR
jgi:hypothetical protein